MCIRDRDNSVSIELAIKTAPRFGIFEKDAENIAKEMTSIIRDNWELLAKEQGLSRAQIEDMRPAFAECYRDHLGELLP